VVIYEFSQHHVLPELEVEDGEYHLEVRDLHGAAKDSNA